MYGGLLPDTGGLLLNPLRVLYILITLGVFGGSWMTSKLLKRSAE